MDIGAARRGLLTFGLGNRPMALLADRCALVIPHEKLSSVRVPDMEAAAVRTFVGNDEITRFGTSTIRRNRGLRHGFVAPLSLTAAEMSGISPRLARHIDIMSQAWDSRRRSIGSKVPDGMSASPGRADLQVRNRSNRQKTDYRIP